MLAFDARHVNLEPLSPSFTTLKIPDVRTFCAGLCCVSVKKGSYCRIGLPLSLKTIQPDYRANLKIPSSNRKCQATMSRKVTGETKERAMDEPDRLT
nr:hypothetical protein [Paraburkholderia sp. BL8N3]